MFAGFMLNGWIVATLVAVVAGVVGFFVVIRGASFAAHALPLGAFPGAAAANLFGVDPLFGLAAFAALGVIGISLLSRHGRPEVATALCLVTLLGLGTLLLSLSQGYAQSVYALLFGEILGVGSGQIVPVAAISALAVAAVVALFRPLLLSSLAPELAGAHGLSGGRIELCFLAVLGLAVAVAVPVVGVLLVFSLMIGPPALARALTDRPAVALLVSAALALVTVWAALALSYMTDWPVGFFVGSAGAICYVLGRCCGGLGIAAAPGRG